MANAHQSTTGATVSQQVCGPCDCSLAKYKVRMKVTGVWNGTGGRRWRYYFEHKMPPLARPGIISVDARNIDDPANGSPSWRRKLERYWATPPRRTNTMVQLTAEKQEENALPPCGTITPGGGTQQTTTTPRTGCLAPGFRDDGLRLGSLATYAGATASTLPLIGHLDPALADCGPDAEGRTVCLWSFHPWTGLPLPDRFSGYDAVIDESDGAAPEYILGSPTAIVDEAEPPVAIAGMVPVAALSRGGEAVGGLTSAVFEVEGEALAGSPPLVLRVVSDTFKVYYTVPVAPDGSFEVDVNALSHGAQDVQLLASPAMAEQVHATVTPGDPTTSCAAGPQQ